MSERSYSIEKYKYVGPPMELESPVYEIDTVRLHEGSIVNAEVNVNIATIYSVWSGDLEFPVTDTQVAAMYLKSVERPIHFDSADEIDVPPLLRQCFSAITMANANHFVPPMGRDWELSEKSKQELKDEFGWDCKTIGDLDKKVNDKWERVKKRHKWRL